MGKYTTKKKILGESFITNAKKLRFKCINIRVGFILNQLKYFDKVRQITTITI